MFKKKQFESLINHKSVKVDLINKISKIQQKKANHKTQLNYLIAIATMTNINQTIINSYCIQVFYL